MKIPVTKQELKALLEDLVAKMDTGNLFVYYQVTRGTGIRNHVYPEGTGNLWVMLKPVSYTHLDVYKRQAVVPLVHPLPMQ